MPSDVRRVIRLSRISPRLALRSLSRWSKLPVPPTGSEECDLAYATGRVESFREGPLWLALELAMLGRAWGFEPADVRRPVTLWYGERDVVTPVSIGEEYARTLPDATLRVVDDTHQMLFSRWETILKDLKTHALAERAARIFN
jgi:pimeloyl-ACP methyl ester carboxylesterase